MNTERRQGMTILVAEPPVLLLANYYYGTRIEAPAVNNPAISRAIFCPDPESLMSVQSSTQISLQSSAQRHFLSHIFHS